MEDWEKGSFRNQRKHQQDKGFHHHGGRGGGGRGFRPSLKYGNPPASVGSWQATVPLWEKQFCYRVGSISWKKLCESKTFVNYHKNIVNWDDSAGEEAFHDAKSRYWAQINYLPCNIPLPDPDLYISEIDWEAEVDPELVLDLEKDESLAVPSGDVEIEKNASYLTVGWDSFPLHNEEIQPTGWVMKNENHLSSTGWRDVETKENNISGDCWGQKDVWVNSKESTPLAKSAWEDMNNKNSDSYWNADGGWGDGKAVKEDAWDQWGSNCWRQNNDGSWETSQLKSGTGYDQSDHRTYFEKMDKDWDNYHHNHNSSSYCRGRRINYSNGRQLGHSKWNRAQPNWNSLHTCGPMK